VIKQSKNTYFVGIETSFLEEMCPKHCRGGEEETRQQWQVRKALAFLTWSGVFFFKFLNYFILFLF